jgi:hypothetical protein
LEPSSNATTSSEASVLSERELTESRRFREEFGLRADDAWIHAVAADPAAEEGRLTFGVPLLPFERADLFSRPQSDDVVRTFDTYGRAFPDDWAGQFFDQQAGGIQVIAFKNNVDRHRMALEELLPGFAFEVREVAWSRRDLEAFVDEIEADTAWFEDIEARFYTADASALDVRISFYGDPAAAELIAAHYGNPAWLTTKHMGPLPWEGPRGDLVIHVINAEGRPVKGLYCLPRAVDPLIDGGEAYSITDVDGQCIIKRLAATSYRVDIEKHAGDDPVLLASSRTTVTPRGPTFVEIEIK